jgi:hypothetical protein
VRGLDDEHALGGHDRANARDRDDRASPAPRANDESSRQVRIAVAKQLLDHAADRPLDLEAFTARKPVASHRPIALKPVHEHRHLRFPPAARTQTRTTIRRCAFERPC